MKLRVSECAQHLRVDIKPYCLPRKRVPTKRFNDFCLYGDFRRCAGSQPVFDNPRPSTRPRPLTSQLLEPSTNNCTDSLAAAASAALLETGPPVPADTQSVPAAGIDNASGLSSSAVSTQLQVAHYARSSMAPVLNRPCTNCGIGHSPAWRRGPAGPNTLCNRCGLKLKRHGPAALIPECAASKAATLEVPTTVDDDKSVNTSKSSSRVAVKPRARKADQATGSGSYWRQCCNQSSEGTKGSKTRQPQGLKRKRSSDGEDSVGNCNPSGSKRAAQQHAYYVVATADDNATASGADGPSEMQVEVNEAEAVELLALVAQLAGGHCGVRTSKRIAQRRSNKKQEEAIALAEVTGAAEVLLHMAGCST